MLKIRLKLGCGLTYLSVQLKKSYCIFKAVLLQVLLNNER